MDPSKAGEEDKLANNYQRNPTFRNLLDMVGIAECSYTARGTLPHPFTGKLKRVPSGAAVPDRTPAEHTGGSQQNIDSKPNFTTFQQKTRQKTESQEKLTTSGLETQTVFSSTAASKDTEEELSKLFEQKMGMGDVHDPDTPTSNSGKLSFAQVAFGPCSQAPNSPISATLPVGRAGQSSGVKKALIKGLSPYEQRRRATRSDISAAVRQRKLLDYKPGRRPELIRIALGPFSEANEGIASSVTTRTPAETPLPISGTPQLRIQPPILSISPRAKPICILDTPLEVRERIYAFVFERTPTRISVDNATTLYRWTLQPGTLPDICFTSKQIWQESVLHFIRRTRFILTAINESYVRKPEKKFKNWLKMLPDSQGLLAVRMLSFPQQRFGRDLPSLVSHCSGIRSLVITVGMSAVSEAIEEPKDYPDQMSKYYYRTYSLEELRIKNAYAPLFALKNLHHLRLIFRVYYGHDKDEYQNFVFLINEGFGDRAKHMEIGIEYRE